MKYWGTLHTDGRIVKDALLESAYQKKGEIEDYAALVSELCRALDLSRPVLLKKHLNDLDRFSRTVFKSEDFMESVDFDKFEVELFFKDIKDAPKSEKLAD
ncbi:MAG TPA: hypothetical protein VN512_04025 [Clostridia bacterium]|nr:hypothetical protein [Clostridia bacterium]